MLYVAIVVVLYFVIGIGIISLVILTFIALVSYTLTVFTKGHKAIHDYIAGTIVVDKAKSEIYNNYDEAIRVKESIESVTPIIADVETPRDESILYKNTDFDNNNKEG